MTAPDIRLAMFLPADDQLRVWELRDELRPSVRWHEMMHEDHATAFTVAKVARLDILRAIRASLDKAMREGRTFEAWKADLVPELKKAGWWGLVADADITGTHKPVIVNERRLQTIFRTNIRMSQAAGRWAKIQREKHLAPFLRYISDHYRKDPRLDHRSWHGVILPVDHPWWQTHFPPNGWGCGCRYQQLSQDMMDARGWTVSEPPDDGPPVPFHAAASAEPIMVPRGIHPGFGYNPGTAHLRAIADKANRSIEQAVEAGLDGAARETVEALVADPAFAQFRKLPDVAFPVQVLSREQAGALDAQARIVRFSLDSLAKQERVHPDLSDADYARLSSIIGEPDWIERQSGNRTAFYRTFDGRSFRAAVKATEAGDELFMVHFQYLRADEYSRLRRRRGWIAGWSKLLEDWLGAR